MRKEMMAALGVILCAGAVVSVVGSSCMTAQASYRTETTVTPGAQADEYVVHIKIMDSAKQGNEAVLSAPKLHVKTGEEGKCTVSDLNEQNGLFCTAIVNEIEGGIEAVTSVVMKHNGEPKHSEAQSVRLKK